MTRAPLATLVACALSLAACSSTPDEEPRPERAIPRAIQPNIEVPAAAWSYPERLRGATASLALLGGDEVDSVELEAFRLRFEESLFQPPSPLLQSAAVGGEALHVRVTVTLEDRPHADPAAPELPLMIAGIVQIEAVEPGAEGVRLVTAIELDQPTSHTWRQELRREHAGVLGRLAARRLLNVLSKQPRRR